MMISKENKETFLLLAIMLIVGIAYSYFSITRAEKENLYSQELKAWNLQADSKAENIKVSNPTIHVESKNEYLAHTVSFKEFPEVFIPVSTKDISKLTDSKHISLLQIMYRNQKCILGLVSENGVFFESSFKDVFNKGCIKL